MTSNSIIVFITLPGQLKPVPAGIFRNENATGSFLYGKRYLERKDAIPIDPVSLPLCSSVQSTVMNKGIFGAIRDALPDYWGRLVLAKELQKPLREIDDLTALNFSSNERMGALMFSSSPEEIPKTVKMRDYRDLEFLNKAADDLAQNRAIERAILHLLFPGTSLGGARPKAVISLDGELWLAKFPVSNEELNSCRIEYATMKLAGLAGINIPEIRVEQIAGKDIYLVKRFDRKGADNELYKHHFLSAMTVLQVEDVKAYESSYQDIADTIRKFCCNPQAQQKDLFRRMVFNVFCRNTDDHLRNHGFLLKNEGWQLSPAYDITPTPAKEGLASPFHLSIGIGKQGQVATIQNLLSDIGRFGLKDQEARQIIEDVRLVIADWRKTFTKCAVSDSDIEAISWCFDQFTH